MICPGCKKEVKDEVEQCPECGIKFDFSKKKKRFKLNIKKNNKLKLISVIVLLVIITVAVLISLFIFAGNKGERVSDKLSKKIGELSEKSISSSGIEFVSSSDYEFLNSLINSNVIGESDKKIKIYGVNIPQWAIYCSEDKFGKLSTVTYCDFRVLSNNINGIKKNSRVDISYISSGKTEKEVDNYLDMKPYQIFYSESMKSKKYKYYYIDKQSENVKAYYITVIYDKTEHTVTAPAIEEENDFIGEILKVGVK